jgi:hypothetical protein
MIEDPPAWRKKCTGFYAEDDKSARLLARNVLAQEAKGFHETRNVESEVAQDGNLVMNRKHFGKHFAKWEIEDEDMPHEQKLKLANQKFDECLIEQGDVHKRKGANEDRVSWPDPKGRQFTETRCDRVDGVRQAAGISNQQFHARKKRMQEKAGFADVDSGDEQEEDAPVGNRLREPHSSVDGGNTMSRPTVVAASSGATLSVANGVGNLDEDTASATSKDTKVLDPTTFA